MGREWMACVEAALAWDSIVFQYFRDIFRNDVIWGQKAPNMWLSTTVMNVMRIAYIPSPLRVTHTGTQAAPVASSSSTNSCTIRAPNRPCLPNCTPDRIDISRGHLHALFSHKGCCKNSMLLHSELTETGVYGPPSQRRKRYHCCMFADSSMMCYYGKCDWFPRQKLAQERSDGNTQVQCDCSKAAAG